MWVSGKFKTISAVLDWRDRCRYTLELEYDFFTFCKNSYYSKIFHSQDHRGSPMAHTVSTPNQPSIREVLRDRVRIPKQCRQCFYISVLSDSWLSWLQVCPLRLQVMSKAGSCNVGVVPGASKSGSSLECIVWLENRFSSCTKVQW